MATLEQLSHGLLLSMMWYGMKYPFGQFGSDVLAASRSEHFPLWWLHIAGKLNFTKLLCYSPSWKDEKGGRMYYREKKSSHIWRKWQWNSKKKKEKNRKRCAEAKRKRLFTPPHHYQPRPGKLGLKSVVVVWEDRCFLNDSIPSTFSVFLFFLIIFCSGCDDKWCAITLWLL